MAFRSAALSTIECLIEASTEQIKNGKKSASSQLLIFFSLYVANFEKVGDRFMELMISQKIVAKDALQLDNFHFLIIITMVLVMLG